MPVVNRRGEFQCKKPTPDINENHKSNHRLCVYLKRADGSAPAYVNEVERLDHKKIKKDRQKPVLFDFLMIDFRLRLSIPIASDRHVSHIPEIHKNVRKPIRVAVTQVEPGIPIDPDRRRPVVVPVAHHRLIAR